MPRDIEYFIEDTGEALPEGPYMTLPSRKATLYFDGASSKLIREHSPEEPAVRLAIDWDRERALVILCTVGAPGAKRLSGGATGKGPGTFQVGGVNNFFKKYQVSRSKKQRFPLEWDFTLQGFYFDIESLPAMAKKR